MRKPVYGIVRSSKTNWRRKLENLGITDITTYTILAVNNKGVAQTVRMRRLICVFVVGT